MLNFNFSEIKPITKEEIFGIIIFFFFLFTMDNAFFSITLSLLAYLSSSLFIKSLKKKNASKIKIKK
jgi:hypothetical protein